MITDTKNPIDLSGHIDVVENITREEFQLKYMKPQRPVIIRHLYGKNAKVYNWTFDYFKRKRWATLMWECSTTSQKAEKTTAVTKTLQKQ
ncbi:MAG: hypothetical protein IPO04_15155 [Cytophagaceae bacterium]|nr:hypothetical protein [Cytophagaceae bacterium]